MWKTTNKNHLCNKWFLSFISDYLFHVILVYSTFEISCQVFIPEELTVKQIDSITSPVM